MMNYPERGMYWHLICYCWVQGSLPADLGAISRILQVDVCAVEDAWRQIGKCFKVSSKDHAILLHPRLEIERDKQEQWRKKCGLGGKHSAHKRKHKKYLDTEQVSCQIVPSKPQLKVNSSTASASANTSVPSEQTIFKNFITTEYEKERNCKLITDKADWIQLNSLFKSCNGTITVEQLRNAWIAFLQSNDQFHHKQGHPLRWWCSNINAFLGDRPTPGKKPEDTSFLFPEDLKHVK
jgi:hypothetical protein